MRISDWSSTCALPIWVDDFSQNLALQLLPALNDSTKLFKDPEFKQAIDGIAESIGFVASKAIEAAGGLAKLYNQSRSEERRVGKECVSTCRSRWSQSH